MSFYQCEWLEDTTQECHEKPEFTIRYLPWRNLPRIAICESLIPFWIHRIPCVIFGLTTRQIKQKGLSQQQTILLFAELESFLAWGMQRRFLRILTELPFNQPKKAER